MLHISDFKIFIKHKCKITNFKLGKIRPSLFVELYREHLCHEIRSKNVFTILTFDRSRHLHMFCLVPNSKCLVCTFLKDIWVEHLDLDVLSKQFHLQKVIRNDSWFRYVYVRWTFQQGLLFKTIRPAPWKLFRPWHKLIPIRP